MSNVRTALEKAIRAILCARIRELIAKNKNNPILTELLMEVAKEYGCEAEEQ